MKRLAAMSALLVLIVSGCSAPSSGENASADNGVEEQELTLAHIHGEGSPVYSSLEAFAEKVEELSDGQMTVNIYGEATLGGETKLLELLKTDVLDMAKVNAGVLESFAPEFSVFSLPYIFEDKEHYQRVMHSDVVAEMYAGLEETGLRGITHFEAGTRSFYTADTPIEHPDDLNGLKIRVMNNATSIRTMELLGASPTPLPAPDVYPGLQQGIIDGAESSHIALTDANHGEVAKVFSYDEHTRIPDFLMMSAGTWNSFSEQEKEIIEEAAAYSTELHDDNWEELMEESKEQAKTEMGVTFYEDIDKEPFRERVEPLIEERRENENIAEILDAFEQLAE